MIRRLIITGVAATMVSAVPAGAAFAAAPGTASAPVVPAVGATALVVAAPRVALAAAVAAGTAAPSPGPDMKALVASVGALKTTSHNLDMTTPRAQIHAAVDPAHGEGMLVDREGTSEFDETVQHGQVWLKINIDPATNKQLGISPDTWLALDMKRLPKRNALPIPPDGSDPIDMPGILTGVTNVKQTSATSFTGTIDLTKITGRNMPNPTEVHRAGAAATHAPFTASIDANNRLTEFNVNTTAFDPGLSLVVKYANYGTDPNVKPPASSVPAPPSLYLVLSN